MKRILPVALVLLVILALFSCSQNKLSNPKENLKPYEIGFEPRNAEIQKPDGFNIVFGALKDGEYVEGKLLIGYESPKYRAEVDKIIKTLGAKVVKEIPQINVVSISFKGTVKEAYDKIRKLDLKGIRYVEPSYKRELIEPTRVTVDPSILSSKGKISTLAVRDYGEELSNELWGLEAMGITKELLDEASGTNVIVAVVDTGVDGTHPDLEGQVIAGYRPYFDEELPEGVDSSYGGAHGTHVAGTIAAKKDGKGIVGVAPNAKIMPIVIFDDPAIVGGNGYVGDDFVAAGIIWAVDHGAKVMNHSWGGWGYSYTMKAAFDYALKNNVAMVVSAGNSHSDSHHQYPAGYPGVIQVAAVEYYGGFYRTVFFSSRSDGVTVGAPGVMILSTVPGLESLGYEGHNENVRATNGGTYDYYQGTSMAAPHVTGAIAVLLQKYPNAKVWQLRKLLESTAKDIDKPGWDTDSGYGLLQLDKALQTALPSDGAVDYFKVKVTDAYGESGVPTMFVQLIRQNGSSYYAKTERDGYAVFYHIDNGDYELIIGGPDHWDRSLAPTEEGSLEGAYAINWRMEEERQISQPITINSSMEMTFKLNSSIKVEFETDVGSTTFLLVTDPTANKVYYASEYSPNVVYDLSHLSGQVVISVVKREPVTTDVTVDGTVTINDVQIPVSGTIKAGKTFAVLDEYGGLNFGAEESPLFLWWTVFGKN
uniref:Peptidase S8 n=1 Tax=Fervidobacterium pennivorans TaxID=93466 RepID=A0A7V4FJL7_FERPE